MTGLNISSSGLALSSAAPTSLLTFATTSGDSRPSMITAPSRCSAA
jgi:hypothetical protein